MINAILPHTLAVFAVGSTRVYGYDLRSMHDTKKYYVQEEWNVTMSGYQYVSHVVVYIPSVSYTHLTLPTTPYV